MWGKYSIDSKDIKIIVNPKKKLFLEEVEYVSPLVSHKGVSFTKEKRQKNTERSTTTYA